MNERKMVNLHPVTAGMLEVKLERINRARKKESKKPLTNGDVIQLALSNLTIEMGIHS